VFSFQRYKGAGATVFQEKVEAIDALAPYRVRFRLREPWPDFLISLGTNATGAGLVLPKTYLEQVGVDGFKQHPIGAGPYKFVRHTPGVDLVLEANEAYWCKVPTVKRLVFNSIPEGTTRLVALKKGEIDIAYAMNGEIGDAVRHDPQLTLRVNSLPTTYWGRAPRQMGPQVPLARPSRASGRRLCHRPHRPMVWRRSVSSPRARSRLPGASDRLSP
jgi:peptide/nickel transport system substrate-binding protein